MKVQIADVKVNDRKRPLKDVGQLAQSIKEIGLLNPITVTGDMSLVAGLHRLKACESLGWQEIEANVVQLDTLQAELAEIDENLIRAELVQLERSRQLKRRKEIYEALHPETKRGIAGATVRHSANSANETVSFASDTAQKIGRSPRTVEHDVQIAESIPEDLQERLAATPIVDHKTNLLAIARLDEPEQRKAVENIEQGISPKSAIWKAKQKPRPAAIIDEDAASPEVYIGSADNMPLVAESVDLIITSPPYNLGDDNWPMGGDGRTRRESGIGYQDARNQDDYEEWQTDCLNEMWRVAKPGASLFYNHKVRTLNGQLIHPLLWVINSRWIVRQEIIWDRKSTHNHNPRLFYPEDERIYWLTKGANPTLPDRSIGMSTIWREFGAVPHQSWHPAPFTEKLPEMIIEAVGRDGITVLDPFMGSGTTLRVALRYGYRAIGIEINEKYAGRTCKEHGWKKARPEG
ncbi:hypothetical protein GF380_06210 [Candidatus Uhrbacteria bacterium]|nr:hypothetical protein [Candidatus Uhrbacteria bacterium]